MVQVLKLTGAGCMMWYCVILYSLTLLYPCVFRSNRPSLLRDRFGSSYRGRGGDREFEQTCRRCVSCSRRRDKTRRRRRTSSGRPGRSAGDTPTPCAWR